MSRRPLSTLTVADMLGPVEPGPVRFEKPTRPSTLRGKVIRRDTPRPCADRPDDIAAMVAANDC